MSIGGHPPWNFVTLFFLLVKVRVLTGVFVLRFGHRRGLVRLVQRSRTRPGPAFVGASSCLPFDTSQFWSLPPGSQPCSANLWHDSIAVSHVVTHPPQSRLSLTPEHNVVVLGGASLRKSLQVSEPAVEIGKGNP
ncbi:hypothetical protein VPH35_106854 [Triticum aestivum]